MELDEHEQGERVRTWLRQNGSSLITGMAMGLALVFGWQWWQGKGVRHQEEAATQFQAFSAAVEAKDAAKVKTFADLLASEYEDTAYADLAVLGYASFLHETGKDGEAIKQLRAALPTVERAELAEIFRLRLARLLLIAGKADEASKEIAAITNPRYPSVAQELRGDIATAQGRRDDARKAYQLALTTLDQAAPTRPIIELKLIDAGGEPPATPEA